MNSMIEMLKRLKVFFLKFYTYFMVCLSYFSVCPFIDPLFSLAERLCVPFLEANRQCKLNTGKLALSNRK